MEDKIATQLLLSFPGQVLVKFSDEPRFSESDEQLVKFTTWLLSNPKRFKKSMNQMLQIPIVRADQVLGTRYVIDMLKDFEDKKEWICWSILNS